MKSLKHGLGDRTARHSAGYDRRPHVLRDRLGLDRLQFPRSWPHAASVLAAEPGLCPAGRGLRSADRGCKKHAAKVFPAGSKVSIQRFPLVTLRCHAIQLSLLLRITCDAT